MAESVEVKNIMAFLEKVKGKKAMQKLEGELKFEERDCEAFKLEL